MKLAQKGINKCSRSFARSSHRVVVYTPKELVLDGVHLNSIYNNNRHIKRGFTVVSLVH